MSGNVVCQAEGTSPTTPDAGASQQCPGPIAESVGPGTQEAAEGSPKRGRRLGPFLFAGETLVASRSGVSKPAGVAGRHWDHTSAPGCPSEKLPLG